MAGVRPAGPEDLDGVTGLWSELLAYHASLDEHDRLRPGAEREFSHFLKGLLVDADAAVFVWEEAGGLLGFVSAEVRAAPPVLVERRRGEMVDLMVHSSARRRGIGRALVQTATRWARENGAERIVVRVAAGNAAGQAFWRALGYAEFVTILQSGLK
jgi:acetyltransferase